MVVVVSKVACCAFPNRSAKKWKVCFRRTTYLLSESSAHHSRLSEQAYQKGTYCKVWERQRVQIVQIWLYLPGGGHSAKPGWLTSVICLPKLSRAGPHTYVRLLILEETSSQISLPSSIEFDSRALWPFILAQTKKKRRTPNVPKGSYSRKNEQNHTFTVRSEQQIHFCCSSGVKFVWFNFKRECTDLSERSSSSRDGE